MSIHEPARWIISYDIRDARRGRAVHRFLKKNALPAQYSVFIVEASAAALHKLMLGLEECVDARVDDVRAYRWPQQPECHMLGAGMLPEGVLLEAPRPAARSVRRSGKSADVEQVPQQVRQN